MTKTISTQLPKPVTAFVADAGIGKPRNAFVGNAGVGMKLREWDIKWEIRWGHKWTETPVVVTINGAAFEPIMAWNAKEQRIEIRPGNPIRQ